MRGKSTIVFMALAALLLFAVAAQARAGSQKIVTALLEGATFATKTIHLPQGYRADKAEVSLIINSEEETSVDVLLGNQTVKLAWPKDKSAKVNLRHDTSSQLPVSVSANRPVTFVVSVEVTCVPR